MLSLSQHNTTTPGLLAAAVALLILAAPPLAEAKMYKWVDENGQMHFGDKIPEKYRAKQHQELNEQGVVVKNREAAKTREQLEEEKRQAAIRKKEEAEAKKQAQRDRVLLDTYTTERDLILARDSRIEAVESQIKLSESIITESNKNIDQLDKQITGIKASNRDVPEDLYRRLDIERKQVEVQDGMMQSHIQRKQEIEKQFNGYIERFRVLKAEQKAKRDRIAKERAGQY